MDWILGKLDAIRLAKVARTHGATRVPRRVDGRHDHFRQWPGTGTREVVLKMSETRSTKNHAVAHLGRECRVVVHPANGGIGDRDTMLLARLSG